MSQAKHSGRSHPARGRQRNPAAAAERLAEAFRGAPVDEVITLREQVHFHQHLPVCGGLMQLVFSGGPVKCLEFDLDRSGNYKPEKIETWLCSNERGTQLFVEGGDQVVELSDFGIPDTGKELIDLGRLRSVVYWTQKMHLGKLDKKPGPYEHPFGKDPDTGAKVELPRLQYDVLNQKLQFVGGIYRIPIDIDGRYSSGIND